MSLQNLGKIDRVWGYEVLWANNEDYSGKLLIFEQAGSHTSMMYHQSHRKSWFVNAGKFKFTFIDTKTGSMQDIVLEEGRTVDLGELSPHRLEALVPNSMIFEVGTAEHVEDRFLISPDDKKQSVDLKKS